MMNTARLAAAALALAGVAVHSGPARAASPGQTWYWSEATMNAAIRADYSYDPAVAEPNDPWHYDLTTVQCQGAGPFVGATGPRHFQRFGCTLTYTATDPAIADYVDRMAARVTGPDSQEEADPPAVADPARPATATARALLGFRDWAPVDIDAKNPPSLLVRPRTLLLLGPARVLADSPWVSRIAWKTWGGPTAVGTGRSRTKTYDPWSGVRLVAFRPRACGHATAYTRVRATSRYRDRGRTRTSAHTWSMPRCPIQVR